MSIQTLSRRSFSKAVAVAPFLLSAQTGSLETHIRLDPARTIGEIDPKIYGNFAEHLGRCIEGGIFDEGSKLSDVNGYRKDVLKAAKDLNVTLLRWPGGNFSSNYHWMDGIGPRNERPARLELAWHTIEDNRFGTHEFLNYTELLGTKPYVCANLGTGTWGEAQQWVEYCNFPEGTAMTKLRQKNGREKPWKVEIWGLGNEMDGPWQMGHRTADDYGKFALEAAKMMKWTDPSIKLIAAGSSNYGADWVGWNRTVLEHLKTHADYLSMHLYVGNKENNYYEFLASNLDLAAKTRIAEGIINGALASAPKGRKIYLAWDEWNVWYRARGAGKESGRDILEEHYNLEDALVVATFLNTFINHAHIVRIANMAQLVNVIAPIFTSKTGLYLQTIYYPLQLIANNSSGAALDLLVDGPTYRSEKFGAVPYIDVSAAKDGNKLVLNIVNRHLDRPVDVVFEAEAGNFGNSFEVSEVNGPDIKAENNFASTKVGIAHKPPVSAKGNRLAYRVPPHSFTMLKGSLG
jgi:alpha-N-arabinofuranosidase